MAEVSPSPSERARKNERAILRALASVGQANAAAAMGVNESTVSRMKDTTIAQFSLLLAHLGIKVVPIGVQCFDPEYVEALRLLAARGIREQAPTLDWSELQ